MDGANAFNCCCRIAAFAYIASRGPVWYTAFPFLNLFYATLTFVHIFSQDGGLIYAQPLTAGSSQGCTSGPFFFHISIVELLRKYSKCLLNVADDLFFVEQKGPSTRTQFDNLQLVKEIASDFLAAGLSIVGSKTTLVCNKSSKSRLSNCAVGISLEYDVNVVPSSGPCAVLGTLIVPDAKRGSTIEERFLLEALKKFSAAIDKITQMTTTRFIKHMCLKVAQWKVIYFLSTVSWCVAEWVADYVAKKMKEAIKRVCDVQGEPTHEFLLFTPIEEHGLGFIPMEHLLDTIRQSVANNAIPMLDELGIKHSLVLHPEVSLASVWRRWSKTISPRGRESALHVSWLNAYPSFYMRKMSDEAFSFAVNSLLKRLPHCEYVCRSRKGTFEYAKASPEERYRHFYSCTVCGAAQFHKRHEAILCSLDRTCKYHVVPCEINPKHMPVPGKKKGGPDFLMPALAQIVGDVRVTYHKTMNIAYLAKMKQYRTFTKLMNGVTLPFIMHVDGSVHQKTVQFLLDQFGKSAIVYDIIVNAQFALFSGMAQAYWSLNVRQSSENFDGVLDIDPDSFSSDDDGSDMDVSDVE